jgi:hypothetical protein
MGQTRVDLLHLLEDLRDAYPTSIHETIIVELVANALDSKASRILVDVNPAKGFLTIADNGKGMTKRELTRFHDIAASTKAKGAGIGFAGVGVKLGLLEASSVLTESGSTGRTLATSWRLETPLKAPWNWIDSLGLVGERGTAVRLSIPNGLSPLLDEGFVEAVLQRQFAPLLDPAFEPILSSKYPGGIELTVNGRPLDARLSLNGGTREPLKFRLPRQRRLAGLGYLVKMDQPLPEDQRGIRVSTFGKVICRGWDWIGLGTAAPDTVGGVIEVPGLAACLQTNKADFIREGRPGATYLKFREAIQSVVAQQLAEWGVDRSTKKPEPRNTRHHEKDLKQILNRLVGDFPLLTALGDARAGGQRRLFHEDVGGEAPAAGIVPFEQHDDEKSEGPDQPQAPEGTEESEPPIPRVEELRRAKPNRRGHLQVRIRFEDSPDSSELARLAEAVVWVNQSHPAHGRAVATHSMGYHVALACALALAPLVAPEGQRDFISAFLASWGEVGI